MRGIAVSALLVTQRIIPLLVTHSGFLKSGLAANFSQDHHNICSFLHLTLQKEKPHWI